VDGLPESLLDPAAWPGAVDGPQLVETHISWVFLTGKFAYKVKKPVRFDFLDFSTRERRSHFCEEELRVNQRLAPDLYLGLSRVVRVDDRLCVDRDGELVEHAVRMRQFDRTEELDALLDAGRVTAEELRDFGGRIARQQATAPAATTSGGPAELADTLRACHDNFDALRRHVPAAGEAMAAVTHWTGLEAERLAGAIRRRLAAGRWRECHGDLHCANVVRHAGELWPFDALEFDPALRWIDVANDFAFLWMDLRARGYADLATVALDGWLQESGDFDALDLLPFYAAYRAGVRAKVAALRAAQQPGAGLAAELERYLGALSAAPRRTTPRLIVTTGLSGSGKSFVAAALLAPLGAVRVRSDVERRRLAGLGPAEPSGGLIYTTELTERTYLRLADAAAAALAAGFTVIVDAACLLREQRARLRDVAHARQLPYVLLSVTAPRDVLESRLRRRAATGGDPSEATVEVLAQQLRSAEPLTGDELAEALLVDTSTPLDAARLAESIT
jgi:uncharacterized protein